MFALVPCNSSVLSCLDGLPLLALWKEQQQQEAMAAAHPVREAQGKSFHIGQ